MSEKTVTIAQAAAGNLSECTELFNHYRVFYGYASEPYKCRQFLEARLRLSDAYMTLAYLPEHKNAAGIMICYPVLSSTLLCKQLLLHDLYIRPDSRKKGMGSALIRKAKQIAMSGGYSRIMLRTASDNTAAQKLYEKQGFKKDTKFLTYFYQC